MELQSILFWLFSILGIAGGIGLVLNKNPVHAALSLILNFFSIAGLYLSLQAEFLAVIQILVYAGAIMVLFLFVIMLLNLRKDSLDAPFSFAKVAAWTLGLAFVVEMVIVLKSAMGDTGGQFPKEFAGSTTEQIGAAMMTHYIFPFEMISVVLIAALVGAIVVAKRFSYENDNGDKN